MRKVINAKYLLWLTVMALMFAFSTVGSAGAFARGGKSLHGAASNNDAPQNVIAAVNGADGKTAAPSFALIPDFEASASGPRLVPVRMFETFKAPFYLRRLYAPRAPPVVSI
jgi:hypothetical protein